MRCVNTGWAKKTGLFFESLKLPYMLTWNSVLYTKMFSILSGVTLVYCMSLCLNILCAISV